MKTDFKFQHVESGIPHLSVIDVKLTDDSEWGYAPRVKNYKDDGRRIQVFTNWVSIEEAERIHAKIGEAIRIAKETPAAAPKTPAPPLS